jgi:hypothetical protein
MKCMSSSPRPLLRKCGKRLFSLIRRSKMPIEACSWQKDELPTERKDEGEGGEEVRREDEGEEVRREDEGEGGEEVRREDEGEEVRREDEGEGGEEVRREDEGEEVRREDEGED